MDEYVEPGCKPYVIVISNDVIDLRPEEIIMKDGKPGYHSVVLDEWVEVEPLN